MMKIGDFSKLSPPPAAHLRPLTPPRLTVGAL